jgi:hypothetical protein
MPPQPAWVKTLRGRHDRGEQCLCREACQAPKGGRGYAAKRGEISDALVCGSSRRTISR